MLQISTYLPGARSNDASFVSPAASPVSPIDVIPSPSSSALPSLSTGKAAASRSVRSTTISWMSSGPLFFATNFTVPAGTLATDGTMANSWRPTDTLVVPDGAGDAAVADAGTLA